MKPIMKTVFFFFVAGFFFVACGVAADKLGVGAECASSDKCNQEEKLVCLTDFKGGYCGLKDCTKNDDCPSGSVCVTHTDQKNYCFRVCTDKSECNVNRGAGNESNCSANITLAEGGKSKACIPPSG